MSESQEQPKNQRTGEFTRRRFMKVAASSGMAASLVGQALAQNVDLESVKDLEKEFFSALDRCRNTRAILQGTTVQQLLGNTGTMSFRDILLNGVPHLTNGTEPHNKANLLLKELREDTTFTFRDILLLPRAQWKVGSADRVNISDAMIGCNSYFVFPFTHHHGQNSQDLRQTIEKLLDGWPLTATFPDRSQGFVAAFAMNYSVEPPVPTVVAEIHDHVAESHSKLLWCRHLMKLALENAVLSREPIKFFSVENFQSQLVEKPLVAADSNKERCAYYNGSAWDCRQGGPNDYCKIENGIPSSGTTFCGA